MVVIRIFELTLKTTIMEKVYYIYELNQEVYIDSYFGATFSTDCIDNIRNAIFYSYDAAELYLIENREELEDFDYLQIIEILTYS